eukprot:SAG31_NODE_2369_length_5854_cov_3.778454_4_plen_164_part_00
MLRSVVPTVESVAENVEPRDNVRPSAETGRLGCRSKNELPLECRLSLRSGPVPSAEGRLRSPATLCGRVRLGSRVRVAPAEARAAISARFWGHLRDCSEKDPYSWLVRECSGGRRECLRFGTGPSSGCVIVSRYTTSDLAVPYGSYNIAKDSFFMSLVRQLSL